LQARLSFSGLLLDAEHRLGSCYVLAELGGSLISEPAPMPSIVSNRRMRKESNQPTVTVANIKLEEASFIEAIRRGELEPERALARQIRQDFQSRANHAPGLLLLQKAVRSSIVGWLQHGIFGGDHGMAEEAWNDALYRIWSRIERYDESRSRFLTWVWNQARWAALDLRRKPEAGRDIPYTGEGPKDDEEQSEAAEKRIDLLHKGLEEQAKRQLEEPEPLTRIERRAIKRALGRLTKTEQLLLHLRYVHGFRNVDIARNELLERSIPEEHVRVYVNRAAKRLRKYYDEELRIEPAREEVKAVDDEPRSRD
jgi:RNA polymerase sigma factor (sigma-70 family)